MRIEYLLRASTSAARHPRQSTARVRGRLDARSDRRRIASRGGPGTVYQAVADPICVLHRELHESADCQERQVFLHLWEDVLTELRSGGTRVGLATYRGWNDGDRDLAAAVWCVGRHLRPAVVVETGVAHGLTSRIVLEALERNGSGRLYSIDLPATDPALHGEIGVAVPARRRSRWSYLAGTSRAVLPRLLAQENRVDMFIHDSLHTARNIRFELEAVWPALRPGGVVLVDDIHRSLGFRDFLDGIGPVESFAADHLLGSGMWGAVIKKGTSDDGGTAARDRATVRT